ncbi:MAG: hypothetical protein OSJ66_07285 [Clostridia bacterium]|nr:hypothetical protein [Clostridia bacterium]
MSKIIIYDNKNILIADLDRTESKKERQDFNVAGYKNPVEVYHTEYAAIFTKYKLIHSFSLKKQLKRIEKIFKYHKEKKDVKKNL